MLLRKLTAMDCDEILAALQADDAELARGTSMTSVSPEPAHVVSVTPEKLQRMRARLAARACGGQARVALGVSFKGRPLTSERVDAMEDAEIEELDARYEARLGAAMSKSLGSSLLRLYASAAARFLPPGSQNSCLTLNKIHSLVVLCRVLAVSYTTATACTWHR